VVFELLEADLGRARAGKEEHLQLLEVEVAVGLEAHDDCEVSLRERGTESGEISEAERGVGHWVVFLKQERTN
jgi:hypothetical protein